MNFGKNDSGSEKTEKCDPGGTGGGTGRHRRSRLQVGEWGFPNLKIPPLKPTLTSLPNNTILEVNPMKKLISCEYNFDNCCVELKFTDGSMIAIDTIAVENEVARILFDRSELLLPVGGNPEVRCR